MAILSNLIVQGSGRILQKLYVNDLSVSGDTSFQDISAANGTFSGTLGVTGNTTLNSVTIAGTAQFTRSTDLSGGADNKPAVIIGPNSGGRIEMDGNEIQAKNGPTAVSDLFINIDGGAVYLSNYPSIFARNGTFTTDDLIVNNSAGIKYITSPKIVADNINVLDTLRATTYNIDSTTCQGGQIYVSPTIIFSSNTTVAITAISGTTVTAAIIDSTSINTDTIGGVQWTQYSKIKISGRLGDVVLGNNGNTCTGTLTAKMNTTAGRINCTFTCDNASELSVKTYAAADVHDLRVMIYEKGASSSTSYPVGILLTGYGYNNNSYIDMYQGEDSRTKPRVRLGRLDGLDSSITVGDVAPTGWGLYSDNAFLKGVIYATAGVIGGCTINDGTLEVSTANIKGVIKAEKLAIFSGYQNLVDVDEDLTLSYNQSIDSKWTINTISSNNYLKPQGSGTYWLSDFKPYPFNSQTKLYLDFDYRGTSSSTDTSTVTVYVRLYYYTSSKGYAGFVQLRNFSLGKYTSGEVHKSFSSNISLSESETISYYRICFYSDGDMSTLNFRNIKLREKADSGILAEIGGWNIGDNCLYNGTTSMTSTTAGIYLGTNGIRNYKDASTYVDITQGKITAKGVDLTGTITASDGEIGGWTISSDRIFHTGNTPSANNTVLAPGGISSATSIGGSSGTNTWAFTVKNIFGVTTAGALYSTSGKIGGWTISSNSLVNGTFGTSGSAMICTGTGTAKSIGGSDSISGWTFSSGANFGVTNTGALYCSDVHVSGEITATSGTVGGWTIGSYFLVNGIWGTSDSVMMCTGTGTAKSIGGSPSISGWAFSAGANFGVTNIGALYCSDAHVSGEITATSGTIGGCRIDNGVLQIGIGGRNILRGSMAMPLVTGAGSWAKGSYVASSSTIGTSLTNIDITNSPVSGVTRGVRLTAVSGQLSPGVAQNGYSMQGHIGDTLTFSVWVKSSKANATVRLQPFYSGTSGEAEQYQKNLTVSTTNWTRLSITTDPIQYNHSALIIGYVYLMNATAGDTLDVCAPMLEFSDRASDWTPAEDEIGGFEINGTSIHTMNVAVTSNADNSIALSSADFTRTINETPISGLRFAIGDKFGVTGDGKIYASNVDLTGKIVANDGKIGGWTIGSTFLVNGNWGTSGSVMMCTGTSGAKQIGGSPSISGWAFSAGANFGVTNTGALYANTAVISGSITASSGFIAGWTINTNDLTKGTLGSNNSIYLATADLSTGKDFAGAGSALKTWRLGIGSDFGVTSDGTLYCNNAHISGNINATSGTIGGAAISEDGYLTVNGSNIRYGVNLFVGTRIPEAGAPTIYGSPFLFSDGLSNNGVEYHSGAHGPGYVITDNTKTTSFKIHFGYYYRDGNIGSLVSGTTYTLSFDLEYKLYSNISTSVVNNLLQLGLYLTGSTGASSPEKIMLLDNIVKSTTAGQVIKKKIVFSFIPDSTWEIRIFSPYNISNCANGDYIYFNNLMLEEGAYNSVYSPAPEDDLFLYGEKQASWLNSGDVYNRVLRSKNQFLDKGYNNLIRSISSIHTIVGDSDMENVTLASSKEVIPSYGLQTLGSASMRWAVVYAQNSTINTSDERQKDFTYMYDKYTNLFMSLKPIEFTWKNDSDKRIHLGIGAQTLEKSMRKFGYDNMYMLQYDKESDIYSAVYTELQMLTIPVVQDHEYRIRALEEENEKLRKQIEMLIKEEA